MYTHIQRKNSWLKPSSKHAGRLIITKMRWRVTLLLSLPSRQSQSLSHVATGAMPREPAQAMTCSESGGENIHKYTAHTRTHTHSTASDPLRWSCLDTLLWCCRAVITCDFLQAQHRQRDHSACCNSTKLSHVLHEHSFFERAKHHARARIRGGTRSIAAASLF